MCICRVVNAEPGLGARFVCMCMCACVCVLRILFEWVGVFRMVCVLDVCMCVFNSVHIHIGTHICTYIKSQTHTQTTTYVSRTHTHSPHPGPSAALETTPVDVCVCVCVCVGIRES